MTSNDELKADIIDLDLKIDKRFDVIGERFEALTLAYAQMVDHLTGKKKPKVEPKKYDTVAPGIIMTQEGHAIEKPKLIITDDPNHGELPKHMPNLDMNRKHKIAAKVCKYCDEHFTWDYFKPDFRTAIHVDSEGKIIGNGMCTKFGGGS